LFALAIVFALAIMGVVFASNIYRGQHSVSLAALTPTPDPARTQLQVSLSRFDLWSLSPAAQIEVGTPLDIWVAASGFDDPGIMLERVTTSAVFVAASPSEGSSSTTLVTLEMNSAEASVLETWIAAEAAAARLIAMPSLDRDAPVFALLDSNDGWRTAPGYRVIDIPQGRIEFTSTDLQIGDTVTVQRASLDSAAGSTIEPLSTDARIVQMTVQADNRLVSDVRLLVGAGAERIEDVLMSDSQFAITEIPGTSEVRSRIVFVPYMSDFAQDAPTVFDTLTVSDDMASCAMVDVTGVFVFLEGDAGTMSMMPRLEFTDFGRDARVLAAPLDDSAGWVLEMDDPDQAIRIANSLASGSRLYLQASCH
jgi:hypothetical protein